MDIIDEQMEINIVFGIDKNYILQVFVVIRSILLNSASRFNFWIITFDEIDYVVERLNLKLEEEFHNYSLSVIKFDSGIFNNASLYNSHLTFAAYNRLLIPKTLVGVNKCIYLDADVLVVGDIKNLYNVSVDEYYVAGVRDYSIISTNDEIHKEYLGIGSIEDYINSGVLLMNLKKIREDGVDARWIDGLTLKNMYEDQDVINRVCINNVKVINPKYNMFHFYIQEKLEENVVIHLEKFGVNMNKNEICIVHMGSVFKPWNSLSFKYAYDWWEIASFYKEYDEYKRIRGQMDSISGSVFSLKEVVRNINGKKVIIWGNGKNGKRITDILKNQGITISFIVDSDLNKMGEEYQGVKVVGIENIDISNEYIWLISCRKGFGDVYKVLTENYNVPKELIINVSNCVNKGEFYYRALSTRHYENEIEEIAFQMGVDEIKAKELLLSDKNSEMMGCFYPENWIKQ